MKGCPDLGGVQAMQNKGSDPFVVFTAGISMATSTVKTNQKNAEWNTTHYLLIR